MQRMHADTFCQRFENRADDDNGGNCVDKTADDKKRDRGNEPDAYGSSAETFYRVDE